MARIAPGRGGGGGQQELLHPGPYLLALVWFQRKTSKGGNRYLSCKFEVCGGRFKGRGFFCPMGLDLSKPGTVSRWQMFADACGVTEEFELGEYDDDTETEGDRNIQRLFVGAPFGCEVTRETQGGYTNNGLGKFVFQKHWDQRWPQWADEYRAAREARSSRRPESDVPPAGGDELPADEYQEDDPLDGSGPPAAPPPAAFDDDDDIPF